MIASTSATVVTACALAVLAVVVFTACRSTSSDESSRWLGGTVLEFEEIEVGANSAIRGERLIVVHSQMEFDALWKAHKKLQIPAPPAPKVDFDQYLVVAVFLGDCPSAGYNVDVVDVRSLPANEAEAACLEVHAKKREPDASAAVAQMVTAPFHVVRVARLDGPARLVLR